MQLSKAVPKLTVVGRVLVARTFHQRALDRKLQGILQKPGPILILGSAPGSERPAGLNDTWSVVTINGSQVRLDDWHLPRPDVTVLRDRILEEGEHQGGVWNILAGRTTGHLVTAPEAQVRSNFQSELARRGFVPEAITMLTTPEKGAIINQMSGFFHGYGPSVSNGTFAMMLTLKLQKLAMRNVPLVLAGFSFSTQGYVYEPTGVPSKRNHVRTDRRALKILVERGGRIYAAEGKFAEESGLPLWRG